MSRERRIDATATEMGSNANDGEGSGSEKIPSSIRFDSGGETIHRVSANASSSSSKEKRRSARNKNTAQQNDLMEPVIMSGGRASPTSHFINDNNIRKMDSPGNVNSSSKQASPRESAMTRLKAASQKSLVPDTLSPGKKTTESQTAGASTVAQTALDKLKARRNRTKQDEIEVWDVENPGVDQALKDFTEGALKDALGPNMTMTKAGWLTSAYSQSVIRMFDRYNQGRDQYLDFLVDRDDENKTESAKTRKSQDFLAGFLLVLRYEWSFNTEELLLIPSRYRDGMRHAYSTAAFELRVAQFEDQDKTTLARLFFPGAPDRKALLGQHFAASNPGVAPRESSAAGTLIRFAVEHSIQQNAADLKATNSWEKVNFIHIGMKTLGVFNDRTLAVQFLPCHSEYRNEQGGTITHKAFKESKRSGRAVTEGRRATFPELRLPNKLKEFTSRADQEILRRFNRNSKDITLEALREMLSNAYDATAGPAEFRAPWTFTSWWANTLNESVNRPLERMVDQAIRSSGAYDPAFATNVKGGGKGKGKGSLRQITTRSDGKNPADMIYNQLVDLVRDAQGNFQTLVQAKLGALFHISSARIVDEPTLIVLSNNNFREMCERTRGLESIQALKSLRLVGREGPEPGILHDGAVKFDHRDEGGYYPDYSGGWDHGPQDMRLGDYMYPKGRGKFGKFGDPDSYEPSDYSHDSGKGRGRRGSGYRGSYDYGADPDRDSTRGQSPGGGEAIREAT